jgi:hypothetical protein
VFVGEIAMNSTQNQPLFVGELSIKTCGFSSTGAGQAAEACSPEAWNHGPQIRGIIPRKRPNFSI